MSSRRRFRGRFHWLSAGTPGSSSTFECGDPKPSARDNTALIESIEELQLRRQAEVSHPTANVTSQFSQTVLHRDAPATAGDLADAMLETLDGFVRHVDRGSRFTECESKELEFLARHDPTLLLVYDQAKFVSKKTRYRSHDPIGSTLRFREDREVIGVAHKRKAASFQLLVQIVEKYVTQDRTEWTVDQPGILPVGARARRLQLVAELLRPLHRLASNVRSVAAELCRRLCVQHVP